MEWVKSPVVTDSHIQALRYKNEIHNSVLFFWDCIMQRSVSGEILKKWRNSILLAIAYTKGGMAQKGTRHAAKAKASRLITTAKQKYNLLTFSTWQLTSQWRDANNALTPASLPWLTAKCSGVLLFLLSQTLTLVPLFNMTVTVSPLLSLNTKYNIS